MKDNWYKFKININGFTLAEVLITLVIVGVIAAITIPTVIAYYNKTETASRLKKFYSTFGQAISRSVIDNGYYTNWDLTESESSQRTIDFVNKYLFPYLQIVKKSTPTSNECWADNVRSATTGNVHSQYSNSQPKHSSAILSDGSSLHVWMSKSCQNAWIVVDLNGHKSPNTLGRDIFPFQISFYESGDVRAGLFPNGLLLKEIPSRENLKQQCINDAQYCTALIMADGWEIKNDYPYKI